MESTSDNKDPHRRGARISLDGFKDPLRRPRFIIWTAVALLALAAVVVIALGVTSTKWFCAEGCHKVQDDTIISYERSTHSQVSCMACHMPVNADPITFVLHKAEALGELYLTVTDNFELPLNAHSHVALTMSAEQCEQCHNLATRPVTPARGVLIDHDKHAEKQVSCTICHNRIAHKEDFELTLTDPKSGEKNRKHEQFMTMTACFRCHSQDPGEGELAAPGACEACHPKDFELKPASHREAGFYPEGHADLAQAEETRVAAIEASHEEAAEETGGHGEEGVGTSLPSVASINQCGTCHAEKFCTDCHGVPMPHPQDFMEGHGDSGKRNPRVCARCHGDAVRFCEECHHGSSMNWEYQPGQRWQMQHPQAVRQLGASACFECHDPTYCAHCHVSGTSD